MMASLEPKTKYFSLIAITLFAISAAIVRADSGTDATTFSPSKSTAAAKRVVLQATIHSDGGTNIP